MARSCFTTTLRVLLPVLLCLLSGTMQASNELYYSSDIDDAVDAARMNPLNNTYVGARWYNRTTSRSFNLPPMLNTEMDQEIIEGAMGPTAAGEAAAAQAQQPVVDSALQRQSKSNTISDTQAELRKRDSNETNSEDRVIPPASVFVSEARSQTGVSRNIRAAGVTVKAESRP